MSDSFQSGTAKSKAPEPNPNRLDRTAYSNPELQRPVAEQTSSKQTIIKISKPEGKFFRIHPSPECRLPSVTLLLGAGGKAKLLTSGVSAEVRKQLRAMKRLKDVDLYLAVNEEGSYFVTYFSASQLEISESWVESGRIVAETAMTRWVATSADMAEGGYRIISCNDFPKLAASKPKWELPGEEDAVAMFETCISQNSVHSDSSPAIQNKLAQRQ
jgi:hypothetical protein